jgi:amino acid permease
MAWHGVKHSDSHSLTTHSSYLIIIKGLMPNVVLSLYHDLTSETTEPPAWALSGRVWITIFMAVLIPLGFLRRLDSLRHASFIGLFAVGELGLLQKCDNSEG